VSRGEVQVTELATKKTEPVGAGKAADVSETITIRDLTARESLVLSKAEIVAPIEDAQMLSAESLYEKGKSYLPELEKIDMEIEDLSPMTLEKIREKFGRIDAVTLYSGKVYFGAILSRGAAMKMVTPQGAVLIPINKVKNTTLR